MQYIYKSKTHTDTTNDYMLALGMTEEQIESVLNQSEFEKTQREKKAKVTRNKALSTVELNGVVYDSDSAALENIERTIRIAEANNMADTESINWRLADNTYRETTLAELRQLIVLADAQFVSVWAQFNEWVAGDKLENFSVE